MKKRNLKNIEIGKEETLYKVGYYCYHYFL